MSKVQAFTFYPSGIKMRVKTGAGYFKAWSENKKTNVFEGFSRKILYNYKKILIRNINL